MSKDTPEVGDVWIDGNNRKILITDVHDLINNGYACRKSLEKIIMNCIKQIETIKDLKKFDLKYHRLIQFLGEKK